MNALFLFFLFALAGFGGMLLMYKPQLAKYENTLEFSYKTLPLPYIYILFAAGSLTAFFVTDNSDFVETLTFTRVIVPLIAAPVIYIVCSFFGNAVSAAVTAVCVALTVWLQPVGEGNAYPELPVQVFRILVFAFAFVYCFGSKITNYLPHTFLLPQIMTLSGLAVMTFFGASPLYVSLCAGVLGGAAAGYLSLNFYTVKVEADDAAAVTFSYMVCSLLLLNTGEFGFPSCVVLTSVFWAELIVALVRKFTASGSEYLKENTNYYLAAQRYDVRTLVSGIIKISVLVMVIAWFQLYSSNGYSLPLITVLLALWLDNAMGKPGNGTQSLSEINRKFVADVKQNLKDAGEILTQRRKDK